MSLTPMHFSSVSGSFFDTESAPAATVTTPPSAGAAPKTTTTDCSSDSVDLVTSPCSPSSVNNSPLRSTSTVLHSESIEVLGGVAEPPSDNSSFMVVASSASSTPASEFSETGPVIEATHPVCVDAEDDDENTVSESLAVTVMEPRGGGKGTTTTTKEIVTIPPSTTRHNLHLSLATALTRSGASQTDMDNSSSSDQTLINQNESAASPTLIVEAEKQKQPSTVLSLESYELQTEFSDSTHSFEEVPREDQPPTNTSSGDELETTTSSDIEIISNPPNGCDSSTHSRQSPHKEGGNGNGNGGVSAGTAIGLHLRGHNRGHSR